jgi:enoyl-CoA hydratase/carnithine racemase
VIRVEHRPVESVHEPGGRALVALVTLDRRDKRNALTPDMLGNLGRVADLVRSGEGRAAAVVLAGEGPMFCAGFDLSLCVDDPLASADLLTRLSRACRALRRLPMPVVAAAHGGAIAGGCALLCGCDIVVTDAAARLGYPAVRMGLSPVVSGTLLRTLVSPGSARERMLDPALLRGRDAVRVGLAHECVEKPGDVLPRALQIAHELARKPHHALAATKRWLNEIDGSDDDAAGERALRASLALAGGEEERRLIAELWRPS